MRKCVCENISLDFVHTLYTGKVQSMRVTFNKERKKLLTSHELTVKSWSKNR